MDTRVTLLDHMAFEGISESGHKVRIDSSIESGGEDDGPRPIELVAMALGSCTAMDVISILRKKKQDVTGLEVRLHMDRADEHPRVFTHAEIEYAVSGRSIEEAAVLRAIELSVTKYCPAHAMLSKAFPMELRYCISDEAGKLVCEGTFEPEFA
jgi:putative redox protein